MPEYNALFLPHDEGLKAVAILVHEQNCIAFIFFNSVSIFHDKGGQKLPQEQEK